MISVVKTNSRTVSNEEGCKVEVIKTVENEGGCSNRVERASDISSPK